MKRLLLGSLTVFVVLATGCSESGGSGESAESSSEPSLSASGSALTGVVGRDGTELTVNGEAYTFVGANFYAAASSYHYGCGWPGNDPDEFLETAFTGLRQHARANAVRFWGFQSFALRENPPDSGVVELDFGDFDRVIARARAHDIRLVFVLENQWTECTGLPEGGVPTPNDPDNGGYRNLSWYASGYDTPGALGYPLSYKEYVEAVVSEYAHEPAILMWQLMNEAECKDIPADTESPESAPGTACPGELRDWAHEMADFIRGIEVGLGVETPHLISIGTMGTGQPGTQDENLWLLHDYPSVDVVEVHDYGHDSEAFPGGPLELSYHTRFFAQDGGWDWADGGYLDLQLGRWQPLSWTVPARDYDDTDDMDGHFNRLGLDFSDLPGDWLGPVFVDNVVVDGGDPYTFDGADAAADLAAFDLKDDVAAVSLSAADSVVGEGALAVSFAPGGDDGHAFLKSTELAGVAPGSVITLELFVPNDAPLLPFTSNTVAAAFDMARRLADGHGKPIFIGETGIETGECGGLQVRAELFDAKMDAAFNEGASGYLPWVWHNTSSSGHDFTYGDPLLDVIAEHSPDQLAAPAITELSHTLHGDGSATVTWRTDIPATTELAFGLQPDCHLVEVVPGRRVRHTVTVGGLMSSTTAPPVTRTYCYRAGSRGQGTSLAESEERSFDTPVSTDDPFVVTAVADSGYYYPAKEILDAAATHNPDVHLIPGDWSCENGVTEARDWWDTYCANIRAAAGKVLLALGNHEDEPVPSGYEEFEWNRELVGMGDVGWYQWPDPNDPAFLADPDYRAHFITLDSTGDAYDDPAQREFLLNATGDAGALVDAQLFDWQIVQFHHPFFTSGNGHGGSPHVADEWAKLFDEWGVDLVFMGHEHAYERTHGVCYDGTLSEGCPVYVLTGGGGRGLSGFDPVQPAWSARRARIHQYTRVELRPESASFQAIDVEGRIIDSARILPRPKPTDFDGSGSVNIGLCAAPPRAVEMDCGDGADGDGDGAADCEDPDCEGALCGGGAFCSSGSCGCPPDAAEVCDNGVDDDCDDLVDCADTDACAEDVPCDAFGRLCRSEECECPTTGGEVCDNGADDDCDGATDCEDGDCAGTPACPGPVCGDGGCDGGESCHTCPDDCGVCCPDGACQSGYGEPCESGPDDCGAGPVCGDDLCGADESCETCPGDCGVCPVCGCGNGACEGPDETCMTCPADCGQCCGDASCEAGHGEACDTCPADCGQCCGNSSCDPVYGEACDTCPADCGACPYCHDGECNGSETCEDCEADCGVCPFCGDTACNNGEDCATCPGDCGPCCGNGACEAERGEDCATCEADCGVCPFCGDTACNNGEDCATCPGDCGPCCGNTACEPDRGEDCASCAADCGECCGDGACESDLGEDCATCPGDCGECCGDGACESDRGEDCASCAADCGECCGDGACESDLGEDCATCPGDCGECCGDGACESDRGEDCTSCEIDCGACPTSHNKGLRAALKHKLHLKDADGSWMSASSERPLIGQWTPLSFQVPSNADTPLRYIGWEIDNDDSYAGSLYYDDISLGSASYDFEGGKTYPWRGRSLETMSALVVSSQTGRDGSARSMRVELLPEDSDESVVRVMTPQHVMPGDVLTIHVYVPCDAPVYSSDTPGTGDACGDGLPGPSEKACPGDGMEAKLRHKLYTKEPWHDATEQYPAINGWSTMPYTLPEGSDLSRLGIYLSGHPSGFTGTLQYDAIEITRDGVRQHYWSFEVGPDIWDDEWKGSGISSVGTASIPAPGVVAVDGASSLQVSYSGSSSSGELRLKDFGGIAAGDLFEVNVFVPCGAPIDN